MKITEKSFGILSDGSEVMLYTLEAGELVLSISTYGAAWTSLSMPGKTGRDDILLGYSSLDGFLRDSTFMGATIGRFANRINNGSFTLDNKNYKLNKNDGNHSLHGGRRGFDKRIWQAYPFTESGGAYIRLELKSPDGEEGYPGSLTSVVTYGLTSSNEISADYRAEVDVPCPVNITNHAYFNLNGEGNGDILSHDLCLYAHSYVEVGSDLIPTGRLIPVKGTPFDFTTAKAIGKDYTAVCEGDSAAIGKGYDHCFTLKERDSSKNEAGTPEKPVLQPCAEVYEPKSGRSFKLLTSQPGVQFYSGNFLNGIMGKAGSVYTKNTGFCLETQHYPDSPNQKTFPPALFGPEKPYHEQAFFSFAW